MSSTSDISAADKTTNPAQSTHAEASQIAAAITSVDPSRTQSREPPKMYEVLVDWVITLDLDAMKFEGMNWRQPGSHPNGITYVEAWEKYEDRTCPPYERFELIRYLARINATVQSDVKASIFTRFLVKIGIEAMIQDDGEHMWAAISKHGTQKYGLQSPVSFSMRIGFIPGSPMYRWNWVS